ncbi:MAG: hypothetical protein OQL09_02080 [Gammaproteobacteria bacterium]|nr:hypothetical protein [Gammaproteobacteria bacterium]
MINRKHRRKLDKSEIIGAIIFIALLLTLILLGLAYSPDDNFSSSFFEDVSNAVQWKK